MIKYLLLATIFTIGLFSQTNQRAFHYYTIDNNVALEYFDPIELFKGNHVVGKDTIPFSNNGVSYYFSNWNNQIKFAQNREAFEAQYGGWCAYSMSQKRSKVMPSIYIFRLIEGKLYFFSSEEFAEKFEAKYKELTAKASKNWEEIFSIIPKTEDFPDRNEFY